MVILKVLSELRHSFNKLLGDTSSNIISMCGSGITACHNILALEMSGIKGVPLYVGSGVNGLLIKIDLLQQ